MGLNMNKSQCNKCGAALMSYYLKDGVCNGCRNPELVVTSIPILTNVLLTNSIDVKDFRKLMNKHSLHIDSEMVSGLGKVFRVNCDEQALESILTETHMAWEFY